MKAYSKIVILFVLIVCVFIIIHKKISNNTTENTVNKNFPASSFSRASTISRNNIKNAAKKIIFDNELTIEKLYENRNLRRRENCEIIVRDDWQVNTEVLSSQGYNVSEIGLIKTEINTFLTKVATSIASHTVLIDEESKQYRVESYKNEFMGHLDTLITSLDSDLTEGQVNYILGALPLENFIGFAGKYAVDLKVIEQRSEDNLYNETSVFYRCETDHKDSFESGHKRGRFISRMMGGIEITDQGIALSKH
jgi:hypothetical protein